MTQKSLTTANKSETDNGDEEQKNFINKLLEVVSIALSFLLGRLFKKWF